MKRIVAVGGDVKVVSMFPENKLIDGVNKYWVPLISLYDESDHMNLIWSKTFSLAKRTVYKVSLSPDGTKLAL